MIRFLFVILFHCLSIFKLLSQEVESKSLEKSQFNFSIFSTSEEEMSSDKISKSDSSFYKLEVLEVKDSIIQLSLKLVRYSINYKNNVGVSYYYSTKADIPVCWGCQAIFDSYNASIKQVVDSKIYFFINKHNKSITVRNADFIVDTITSAPSGIKDLMRQSFSNDYFEGIFTLLLGCNLNLIKVKGQLQVDALKISLPISGIGNFIFDYDHVNKDAVSISGKLKYRNPNWKKYPLESDTYANGELKGKMLYSQLSFLPILTNLFFDVKIPSNKDLRFESKGKGVIKIVCEPFKS